MKEYRDKYNEILADFSNDGNYYMVDSYESKYNDAKSDIEDSLKNFDVNGCKENLKAFEDVIESVKKADDTECASFCDKAKSVVNNMESGSDFEQYSLTKLSKKMSDEYQQGNYNNVNKKYEEFQKMSDQFSNMNTDVFQYVQADVSQKGYTNVYFYSDDDYNLNASKFSIYERNENSKNWKKCSVNTVQQIENSGMNIDVLADVSTSMDWQFDIMQDCVSQFIGSTDENTNIALTRFSSDYDMIDDFTDDHDMLQSDVYDCLDCNGCTCLYYSLYQAVLATADTKGAKCVVAFTDGQNEDYTHTKYVSEEDVIKISQQLQVPIYLIGIGDGVEGDKLQSIADRTNGSYYFADKAGDLGDIYTEIYNRQQKMYKISYKTSLNAGIDKEVYAAYLGDGEVSSFYMENYIQGSLMYDEHQVNSDDLTDYYSTDTILDYSNMTFDQLDDIQTIINIYAAKNGYHFTNKNYLQKIIDLGMVDHNGTLSLGDAESKMGKTECKNYVALYNQRDDLIYQEMKKLYKDGYTTKDELRQAIYDEISTRYKSSVETILSKFEKNFENL